jgi:hypothetical protein
MSTSIIVSYSIGSSSFSPQLPRPKTDNKNTIMASLFMVYLYLINQSINFLTDADHRIVL